MKKSKEIPFNLETIIKEHKTLVSSVLDQMTLAQWMEFGVYVRRIDADYLRQEKKHYDTMLTEEETPQPCYKKLSGFEEKSWWKTIQPLFDEQNGEEMSGFTRLYIREYLQKKAEENPVL